MRRTFVVAVLSIAAASACGSGDDSDGRAGTGGTPRAGQGGGGGGGGGDREFDAGSDPGRNDVMPGGICMRLAEIICAGEQACCDSPSRTRERCMTDVSGPCQSSLMADTVAAAPAVAFNAAAAKTAFMELENRARMCDPSLAAWAFSMQGFASSFAGTLGSGENCEPQGGLQAPLDDLAIALASCRVGDGVVCLPGDAGWSCAPRAAAGGRCYNDFNCMEGLYCENPDSEFDGVCMPAKAAGAECDGPLQCASGICGSDDTCAPEGDTQAAFCG